MTQAACRSNVAPMSPAIRRLTLTLLFALCLAGCDNTPDEEQIAENISAMQAAIENRDFIEIGEHLHADFIANDRMRAREVNQLLQMYSLQHKKIGVTIIDSETKMDTAFTDRAETTLSVVVTGSSGLLPSDGSVRTVKVSWLKESGTWLVREAEWRHYKGTRGR